MGAHRTQRAKSPSPRLSRNTGREQGSIALRGGLWVEVGGAIGLTDAGADLLEQIATCGSLSEAARRLRFSYRRAWMLVNAMNKRWHADLVTTAVGGKHGGGTRVTELGQRILRSYRDAQIQLEHALGRAQTGFARAARSVSH